MRRDLGAETILYPMPVLIIGTYGEDGTPDAMNAAWGGIHDTAQIGVCLSADHKTTRNLLARGAFTVSIADAAHVAQADYVGIVSANDVPDKLSRAGLHATPAEHTDAPLFEEFPLALECRVVRYDETSGYLVGDIVNVSADERILGTDGKIDAEKLASIAFDPVALVYRVLGPAVGDAFQIGKTIG